MSGFVRLHDLYVGFEGPDTVIIRSHRRGIVLQAPAFAAAILGFCHVPRSATEVVEQFGAGGLRLFGVLHEAGVLAQDPGAHDLVVPHSLYGQLDLARDSAPGPAVWRAYSSALSLVAPGATVVVFGGTLGILPVMAARAGAVHVDVVDHTAALDGVEMVAQANGVRDRVRLVEGSPESVTLDSPADIAVTAELGAGGLPRGWRGWCQRHLRPGGIEIPRAVHRYVAAAQDADAVSEILDAYDVLGVDLGPMRSGALGYVRRSVPVADLLGEWLPAQSGSRAQMGVAGLVLALEYELAQGVSIDLRHGEPGLDMAPWWLPAQRSQPAEVVVSYGDAGVHARLPDGELCHWRW